jgi:hypothetical protein
LVIPVKTMGGMSHLLPCSSMAPCDGTFMGVTSSC